MPRKKKDSISDHTVRPGQIYEYIYKHGKRDVYVITERHFVHKDGWYMYCFTGAGERGVWELNDVLLDSRMYRLLSEE